MLYSHALTSLEVVEEYLGLSDGQDAVLLERLINAYSSYLEQITGRKLKSRTYTNFRIHGNGRTGILLPEWPVTKVTGLVIQDDSFQNVEIIDVVATNKKLYIDIATGTLYLNESVFATGNFNILITYIAGYLAGSHDAELSLLEQAVLMMIQHAYVNRGVQDTTMRSEKIGDYSYTRAAFKSLPDDIVDGVMSFKRV
jgi:uncharacterized phiE125 gp8 family phage protein